jgi:hypothetical protein
MTNDTLIVPIDGERIDCQVNTLGEQIESSDESLSSLLVKQIENDSIINKDDTHNETQIEVNVDTQNRDNIDTNAQLDKASSNETDA